MPAGLCTYGGRGRGCGSAILKSQYITILFCCGVSPFVFVIFTGVVKAKRTLFTASTTRTIHSEQALKFSGNNFSLTSFVYKRVELLLNGVPPDACRAFRSVSAITAKNMCFFCLFYCHRVQYTKTIICVCTHVCMCVSTRLRVCVY